MPKERTIADILQSLDEHTRSMDQALLALGEKALAVVDHAISFESRLRSLLKDAGEPGVCSRCGGPVLRVPLVKGGTGIYNADGLIHLATCPIIERPLATTPVA